MWLFSKSHSSHLGMTCRAGLRGECRGRWFFSGCKGDANRHQTDGGPQLRHQKSRTHEKYPWIFPQDSG